MSLFNSVEETAKGILTFAALVGVAGILLNSADKTSNLMGAAIVFALVIAVLLVLKAKRLI